MSKAPAKGGMPLVVLDFETHYSSEYSLSRMSPLAYVMDDRFETISCSIKVDNYPTDVFFGDAAVRKALASIDHIIRRALVVAHNMSGFDAYVCAYRYGMRPRMWGCTMAMARPIHAKDVGLGLGKLVAHYGLGVKDNTVLTQTRGKRLADFTPAEIERMRKYNREDTDQCHALFHVLRKHYTPAELWQIDALTRMRTEPQFELDTAMLEVAASVERTRKHKALLDLARMLNLQDIDWSDEDSITEHVRSEMASAAKFSELLVAQGVEVPMKASPTDETRTIPALAKSDEAFLDLQDSDNDVVAAAARTRLDVKSTLLETRIQKFLTAGAMAGGLLPIPLTYCGADTTGRDSGEQYNCFTGEVEVLTRAGWKRFDAWQGEAIMQWWPDGTATFCDNPGVLDKPYAGDIVDIDSVLFSAAMTPEHRLVSVRQGGRVTERTAGWVAAHSGLDGVPTSATWCGTGVSLYSPDEARLMVAIAADGCVLPRNTETAGVQLGFRRQRKIERMRHLLAAVGCPYTERHYAPQETHKGEHDTVQFHLPRCQYPKGLGPWLLQLSRDALDAVVDEIPHWDGWRHHGTGQDEFASTDYSEALWVATVWHLSGTPTTVRTYDRHTENPTRAPMHQLHRRSGVSTSISTSTHVTVREYTGRVYCAGVDSTYIFIRRNGKIAVAGQCQNLPRIDPTKPRPTDALRKSLRAPQGKMVIVADQSGIELRVNHFLWQVASSMAMYQASPDKADLYRSFAASLFNKAESEIDKSERQLGKVAQLGLGFGSGAATFKLVAKSMGGLNLKVGAPDPETGELEDIEPGELTCTEIVKNWRGTYPEITGGWRAAGKALQHIYDGVEVAVDPWGLVVTCKEGFRLPSGRLIRYPDLREEDDGAWPDGRPRRSWFYARGRHKARITGPKAVENMVQALARDSIFDCALEFYKGTALRPALRVHDELVYVVDEGVAQDRLDELQGILRTPPKWWPQLVVWSEGDVAKNYGDAK